MGEPDKIGIENDASLRSLGLIGQSPVMQKLRRDILSLAHARAPILICGETGVGKELVARALHYFGPGAGHPFVPVNCAALVDTLFEKELFGAERGAFTDAREKQVGLVEQASGGSLFLDEINSLCKTSQASLLRFLEGGSYRTVGGRSEQEANLQLIAATNENLLELAQAGEFRRDLFYRLDVVSIYVPPLRERRQDIPLIAQHVLSRLCETYSDQKRLSESLLAWLPTQTWMGNVREMQNWLHRAFLLTTGEEIHPPSWAPVHCVAESRPSYQVAKSEAMSEFERGYLADMLLAADGNVSMAARLAGKERRSFGKLLKKHNIDRTAFIKDRGQY